MAENNRTLAVCAPDEKGSERLLSEMFCNPTVGAATVILDSNPNQGLNINHVVECLEAQTAEIKKGNLEMIETMLWQQAVTLQGVFMAFSGKMARTDHINPKKLYGNIALKAQAQCRQNLQALVEMKQPRSSTVINNRAHNQQVNLHEEWLEKLEDKPATEVTNELLNGVSHAAMDTSGAPAAS